MLARVLLFFGLHLHHMPKGIKQVMLLAFYQNSDYFVIFYVVIKEKLLIFLPSCDIISVQIGILYTSLE